MSNDYSRDSRLDHDDPVWELLGHAPMPQPDAWFTARTLARCRHVGLSLEPGWTMLARIWRWTLGGGLSLSLAIVLVVVQTHSVSSTHTNKQKKVQEAFEIVASLGADSDPSSTTSSSSWQDQDTSL